MFRSQEGKAAFKSQCDLFCYFTVALKKSLHQNNVESLFYKVDCFML